MRLSPGVTGDFHSLEVLAVTETSKSNALVEAGRAAPGNLRYDDVVQANRKNHFTVIEAWKSQSDKNAWVSGKIARTFREELQPIGGALYDERDFKVLR